MPRPAKHDETFRPFPGCHRFRDGNGRMADQTATLPTVAAHGASRLPAVDVDSYKPFMQDVELWGVLTIGTGLGNARFTNRKQTDDEFRCPVASGPARATARC